MITNFQHHTKELVNCELKHIDNLISILSNVEKSNPIKTDELLKVLNYCGTEKKLMKVGGARLRKLINYIRSNGLLPVIGTQYGYFVSYDEKDISNQIKSLTERSNSIMDCVYGLNKILKKNR